MPVSGQGDAQYPSNLRWRCARCTNSCRDMPGRRRNILLTPWDTKRIVRTTKRQADDFSVLARGHVPYERSMRKIRGRCVFLRGPACSIYRARPLICRFYPFSLDMSESGRVRIGYDPACSGIGSGETRHERFYRGLVRLARRELASIGLS